MKKFFELRYEAVRPNEATSMLGYLYQVRDIIDYDVFLPSYGKNLQRPFVWTIEQKQELVYSFLYNRFIPHLAIHHTFDGVYQIIDGKQRLGAILDFIDNKFQITLEGEKYYFKDLPEDYRFGLLRGCYFRYKVVDNEELTDKQKVEWFKFINFAGTPQEKDHLDSFVS